MGLFSVVAKLCEGEKTAQRRGQLLNRSASRTHGANGVRNLCVVGRSSEILTGSLHCFFLPCVLPELEGPGSKNSLSQD